MALDNGTVQEILQKLDHDRDAYLNTLSRAHELLAQALTQTQLGPLPSTAAAIKPRSFSFGTVPGSPTLPPSLSGRRIATNSGFDLEGFKKSSVFTGDDSSESDDDESFFVQEALPRESYTEEDLRTHLSSHPWDNCGRFILKDLLGDPKKLDQTDLLEEKDVSDIHDASHTSDVYEVSSDGAALHATKAESSNGFKSIWEGLRAINADENRKAAVGRISVLREPSPLLCGAIHLTMNKRFDMDSILRLLVDQTPTKAYMKGCLKDDPRHRRSFVFCFKYHTIVGQGREPMPWQRSDEDLTIRKDHIPISTCSSIVALSLAGNSTQTLRRKSRRTKHIVGHIHDPFDPWKVLSIQCFPDWHSSVEVHDTNHHYVNGPEAFMVTLLAEYRDASKRFQELNKRIVKLVTPSTEFLFNNDLRDALLFEKDDYTYSRRYFWAFQALAMLNDEIEALIAQYKETFTNDVWTGDHRYIWPGRSDKSARFSNWRKKMASLRKHFDDEIQKLQGILRANEREQKDIKSLRDQLFSGTSVLESRKAVNQAEITVEQGYNIKLLTLVSIFFLPLTFVTSVFGMTNMDPHESFIHFAIATAAICLPTYFLIGTVNAPNRVQAILGPIRNFFAPLVRWLDRSKTQRAASHSNTVQQADPVRRRMLRSLSALEQTHSHAQTGYQHKPPARRFTQSSFSRPEMAATSENTIKFQFPTYDQPSQSPKLQSRGLAILEKSMSDPGPFPPEAGWEVTKPRRSFIRRVSDRLKGSDSPRSPV